MCEYETYINILYIIPNYTIAFPSGLCESLFVDWSYLKRYDDMDVSENNGTPKSSILIGFSIINHLFWGTPIFGNTHMNSFGYDLTPALEEMVFPAHKGSTPGPSWRRKASRAP